HDYPEHMLFDLEKDPHELNNLAAERPDLLEKGKTLLKEWKEECLQSSQVPQDPKDTVMKEGGPLHARGDIPAYLQRLRETGRGEIADRFETRSAAHSGAAAEQN
ncbi:MAG: sulfatase, partial [Kiritimatiellia bacterium]